MKEKLKYLVFFDEILNFFNVNIILDFKFFLLFFVYIYYLQEPINVQRSTFYGFYIKLNSIVYL